MKKTAPHVLAVVPLHKGSNQPETSERSSALSTCAFLQEIPKSSYEHKNPSKKAVNYALREKKGL